MALSPSTIIVLVLLLSRTILAITPTPTIPTTPNDLFHDFAKHVAKPSEPPICCLKPQPSPEPAEEFLSFEDWKAKQALLQAEAKDASKQASVVNVSDAQPAEPQAEVGQPLANAPEQQQHTLPHFRVPLTDRFDYANLDCSARVHSTHRSAKSPASILSSKKDRYMLSPCNPSSGEQKFVVVELCDDIRIDTVQLANFEFFSGVFKEFSVSVSKTYTTDPAGWTHAGNYKAKNIRGIQVCYRREYLKLHQVTIVLPPVVPHPNKPPRLLPLHSYRFHVALWKRILLPHINSSCLRFDAHGGMEMGSLGGGVPR